MIVCDEMKKLRQMLDKRKIPWEDASDAFEENKEFPMWICRTHIEYKGLTISVINGFGTYGGFTEKENMGLLEIMINGIQLGGWLKAEDIIKAIEGAEK